MEIATLRVGGRIKEGKMGGEGFLISLSLPPTPTPLTCPTSSSRLEFIIALLHAENLRVHRKSLHCRLKVEKKEAFLMKR